MFESHTPGPWKWGRGVDDDQTRCFIVQDVEGQPNYLIAEIQNGAPGDCLETEIANARLMAAAPDLLAALKAVVEQHGPWHDDDCPGDATCDCSAKPLHEAINAAIANAEGIERTRH